MYQKRCDGRSTDVLASGTNREIGLFNFIIITVYVILSKKFCSIFGFFVNVLVSVVIGRVCVIATITEFSFIIKNIFFIVILHSICFHLGKKTIKRTVQKRKTLLSVSVRPGLTVNVSVDLWAVCVCFSRSELVLVVSCVRWLLFLNSVVPDECFEELKKQWFFCAGSTISFYTVIRWNKNAHYLLSVSLTRLASDGSSLALSCQPSQLKLQLFPFPFFGFHQNQIATSFIPLFSQSVSELWT